jgi:DNA-directed RNA polymerase specialized sigma24 family protein
LEAVPLTAADDVPSDDALPDHHLEQRQQAAAALLAIAELPDELREPATLFFVHECSHQDIAAFLDLSLTTVNNRLHAARTRLKRRMLTMVRDTLQAHHCPMISPIGLAASSRRAAMWWRPCSTPHRCPTF